MFKVDLIRRTDFLPRAPGADPAVEPIVEILNLRPTMSYGVPPPRE